MKKSSALFAFAMAACLTASAAVEQKSASAKDATVAGSIELEDVVRALLIKSLAAFALATSIAIGSRMHAVNDFSKYSCASGLTHSSWSAEQIGVCQFAAKHSILQCCGQRLLSHHGVEGHRTVFACRDYIVVHILKEDELF